MAKPSKFFANLAARMIVWQLKLRGTRIIVTRPWSGGEQIVWDGQFHEIIHERVHDGRGYVFWVQALPKTTTTGLFQWETPATRPRLIDFQTLQWDERNQAWASRETT